MQDTLLALLTDAKTVYKKPTKTRGLPKHAYVTIDATDTIEVKAEVWNKSGQFVRVNTVITAKIEHEFRMAVDLDVFHKLIKQAPCERVDLKADFNNMTLEVRVGSMVNELPALPLDEME